jgi:hypothetical protein
MTAATLGGSPLGWIDLEDVIANENDDVAALASRLTGPIVELRCVGSVFQAVG